MPKQTNGRVVPETGKIEYIYDDNILVTGGTGSQTNDDPYGDSCCVSNVPGPPGKNAFENIDKDINFNNFKIINLGDATDPQDGMNLVSTERLLNNLLFGDVIGDLYSPKVVVGLQGRPITDDPPFKNATLIWDIDQQMWIYGIGGGSAAIEVINFDPLHRVLEIGEQVIEPTFFAHYRGIPVKVELTDDQHNTPVEISDFNTFNSPNTFQSDTNGFSVKFTLYAEDEYETSNTSETSIYWGTRAIWGSSADSSDYESMIADFEDKQQFSVLLDPNNDVTVTSGGNEYVYYFHRTDYSEFYDESTFTVNSVTGGIGPIDQYTHVNRFGVPIQYTVYRSEQKNLGKIKILIRSDNKHEGSADVGRMITNAY